MLGQLERDADAATDLLRRCLAWPLPLPVEVEVLRELALALTRNVRSGLRDRLRLPVLVGLADMMLALGPGGERLCLRH